jgi:SnoaL-like domain
VRRRDILAGSAVSVTSAANISSASASARPRVQPDLKRDAAAASAREAREIADMAIIQNLLAGSALSADTGDAAYQNALYADDAIMDLGGSAGEIRGREAIVAIISDPSHTRLRLEGMAHVAAQPHIRVTGNRAVAIGYLQIMSHDTTGAESGPAGKASTDKASTGKTSTGKWVTWRLSVNRWEFEFRAGRWQITRRIIRAAPSSQALQLLHLG